MSRSGMLTLGASSGAGASAWRSLAIVVCLTLAVTLGILTAAPRPASAADHRFALYVSQLGGWSFTPDDRVPGDGPGLLVAKGDNVTIDLFSDDGLLHGLFIDYDGSGFPDDGDFISETTTGTITFSFVPDNVGEFRYCDQLFPVNCGQWTTQGPPSATILSPEAGASWTANVSHSIVFNVTDPERDPVNYSLSYIRGGGAPTPLAGPFPAGTNPHTYSWTPEFHEPDTVIRIVLRDSIGLSATVDSPAFEVDSTHPTIVSRTPLPGTTSVDRGTGIAVTWLEAMNPASGAPNAFGVQVQGGPWIAGTVSWSTDSTEMTFVPASPLSAGTTYVVHVNATARDSSDPGNAFAGPDTWTFSTNALTDPNRPTILSVHADPPQQFPNAPVNLTADVQDDVGVSTVRAAITGPSFDENVTMAHLTGTRWYVNRTFSAVGPYSVTIWASDVAGNFVSETLGFDIAPDGNTGLLAPASVTTKTSEGVVEVTWTPVSFDGLVGYHVYRGEDESGPFVRLTLTPVGTTAPNVYRDTPPSGQTYFYTVRAVNATGAESPYAPRSSVTVPPYRPSPLFDPVAWAIAGLSLALILGVLYGTIWRRKLA